MKIKILYLDNEILLIIRNNTRNIYIAEIAEIYDTNKIY